MKIYFCGSIRGGRDLAGLYHRVIGVLKRYGPVLTEHVGDPNLTEQGNDGLPREIFERDTAWLRECDVVIAECSQVSMGVGYELAYADALGKPCYVFYGKKDGRLSAMVEGNPRFSVHYYNGEEELLRLVSEIMDSIS